MLRRRSLLLLPLLALVLAGCFNPFAPKVSTVRVASVPAPVPNSPANAVKLFQWCWQNRDASIYPEVFTDDYRFVFSPTDSAGNAYRDRPWLREDELTMAKNMFQGGTDRPAASDIVITLDNQLVALNDPRPGMNPKWHRTINTSVNLKFTVDQNGAPDVSVISGYALFYLVRGDSAAIPTDLKGFTADSTRWWIERWEDGTAGATGSPARSLGAARARMASPALYLPPHEESFTALKLTYSDWPPPILATASRSAGRERVR